MDTLHRPRFSLRAVAFVLVATFGCLSGLLFTTQRDSHASVGLLAPVVAALPTSIASSGVLTGVGAVSYFGGTSAAVGSGVAVGGATAAGVALAPVAAAAAAALVAGGALYLGWKWATGNSAGTSYDPITSTTVNNPAVGTRVQRTGYYVEYTGASSQQVTLKAQHTGTRTAGVRMAGRMHCRNNSTQAVTPRDAALSGFGTSFTSSTNTAITCLSSETIIGWTFIVAEGAGGVIPTSEQALASGETLFAGGVLVSGGTSGPSGSTQVTSVPTSQCSGGGSVAGQAVTFTGATDPASLPLILAPACPAGQSRTGFTMPSTYAGGAAAPAPMPGWSAPIIPEAYAECQSPAVCVLTLTKTAPDGSVQNCTNTGVCTGYVGQPGPDAQGNTYTCRWGSYTMPASDCTTLPTQPNPDAPTTTAPGSFPTTGPNPQPSPAPSGTPGTGTPAPNPNPDTDTEGCLSANWSWNPVSWVYAPVKCALSWAFVPSAASTAKVAELQANAASRAPMSWVTQAGGWVVTVLGGPNGSAGGCFVYDVTLGELGSFHIIDSCANEAVPNAIRPWRPLLTVAMYAAFLGPLAWWAWRSYAPLSRPQG